jgi:hypothetical protein
MDTPASKKGMFNGKTKEELRSELATKKAQSKKLHASGKEEPESLKTKIKELEFALRAKNNFGKVSESVFMEGMRPTWEGILHKFADDVDRFIEGEELTDALYDELYEYYLPEMPYGTAKARTGDPMQWVHDHFWQDLEKEGLIANDNTAPLPVDEDEFSNENLGPNWGKAGMTNGRPLGEGKTMRKCMGKGCVKKCADGKKFCGKKCEASKKAVKEIKFVPGPFSRVAKLRENEALTPEQGVFAKFKGQKDRLPKCAGCGRQISNETGQITTPKGDFCSQKCLRNAGNINENLAEGKKKKELDARCKCGHFENGDHKKGNCYYEDSRGKRCKCRAFRKANDE